MNLSPHFTLAEWVRSYEAVRRGIPNDPPAWAIENGKALCLALLEPLRMVVGPIRLLSGYRSLEVNRLVGGARKSDHLDGCAVDIVALDMGTGGLWQACAALPWTKRIWEFGDDLGPAWVHLSYRAGVNQRLSLRAYRVPGRPTRYVPWEG